MPQEIKPMLATLVDEPFSNENWLYEIKWDGYRAVAYMDKDYLDVLSRNNLSFTEKYNPVTEALKALSIRAIFDGEIVAVNEKGLGDFQLLQNWQTTYQGNLHYYVFDIVWLEGYDLTQLPLIERKKILQQIIPPDDSVLKYSDHVLAEGEQFFKAAIKGGLEGIMAKKITGKYELGNRTDTWLKIKVSKRQGSDHCRFYRAKKNKKIFWCFITWCI